MHRHPFCVVMFFLCELVILAFIIVIICKACSSREMFRRFGKLIRPCPFGTGEIYEVKEKHLPHNTALMPEVLFTTSLFGNPDSASFQTRYYAGITRLLGKIAKYWPHARLRIYLAPNLSEKYRQELLQNGAEVYVMDKSPRGLEGTMWRFWAMDDSTAPVVSIDADDDIFDDVYVGFLKAWLQSDKHFFAKQYFWFAIIPLNASRWGAKPHAFQKLRPGFNMKAATETYCDVGYGVDEGFLNREIWPMIKHDCFLSPYSCLQMNWPLVAWALASAVTFPILVFIYPCD